MTQEDRDLLIKDLCARLPYGVKCAYFNTKEELKVGELLTVWCKEKRVFIDKLSIDYDGCDHIGVIPYLFPLSSMTKEQESYMYFNTKFNIDRFDTITPKIDEDDSPMYVDMEDWLELFDWFNKNHFDYRGLILKGLALDATGKNIY